MKEIIQKCHARVGLMGNPSDGFRGKTISFLIENFYAEVTIVKNEQSPQVILRETLTFMDSRNLYNHSVNVVIPSSIIYFVATTLIATLLGL
jgi:hypothetical protein